MEEEVTIPKILTVKRRGDDDYFGQKLSDISVMAFEAREHCDVRIISSEGQFLNAHQVVLCKSSTLKELMELEQMLYVPEIVLVFPQFKLKSLLKVVQFLYTGEVDLVSGSRLLIEFQELCRILKLNPQVKKTKFLEKPKANENKGYNCSLCIASFDKASKLIFHQEQCNKSFKMPVPYESPSHKESAVEAPAKNKDFIVEDDFHQESTTITEEQYLGGSSFQMPDNFDLPDEIIQEQLPKARYTSTPIRYAKDLNEDEKEKDDMQNKSEGTPTKDEKEVKRIKEPTTSEDEEQKRDQKAILKSKGFSMAEDLAEKRKRIMQKIVHDLPPPSTHRATGKNKKRPYDTMKKRTFDGQKKRPKFDSSDDEYEMNDWLVNDDDEEEEDTSENSTSSNTSESEIAVKKESTRLKSVSKLRVSIQLEGMETIMEIQQYRLRLLCSDSSSSEEDKKEEKKVLLRKPHQSRALKLEKVGKRIKRIVSEDSDEEEDEHRPRKCQPPPKPPSAIAKLPRIPKIQRDSKATRDGAGPSHQTTSDTTKWMIPSSSTATKSAVSKTLKTNESGNYQKN